MATFQGETFNERGQNGILTPIHGAGADIGVRPAAIPFLNPRFDLGGAVPVLFSMPIACGTAVLDNLRSWVGTNDSLVYSGGTVSAALVELKDAVLVKDSQDLTFATLDFLTVPSGAAVQELSATVTIVTDNHNAGAGLYLLDANISHGIDQDSGQATITLNTPPALGVGEGGSVGVFLGVNGSTSPMFAGTVVGRSWQQWPITLAVDCRDRMEYLTYPYGGTERTYTSQTLGTVVQNLVEAQGIASANTSIEDSGWTVGVIEPVVFRRGDRFLPWIKNALSLAGYAIFTKGADSAVYVRPLQYGVTNAGTHTFTAGVNILSSQRTVSRDGIANAIQVDGLTYQGATTSVFVGTTNSDVRSPPGTVTYAAQSNIIETPARGTIVANELLSQKNFKPESGVITVPGSAIEPMDVAIVTDSNMGWSGATVAVTQVEQNFGVGGWTTTAHVRKIRA